MTSSASQAQRWKQKMAVALRYRREESGAPVVIAQGEGLLADRIVEKAREHRVPVHQDPELAQSLGKVGVERPIPPELYQAVAELISFVYRMRPEAATR